MLQSTLDEDLEDVSHERRKRPGGAGLLVVFSGGRVVTVPLSPRAGRIVVGRTAETTGTELPDERLSRLHCEVTYAAGEWTIRDLGSRNGTFVDGARVDEVTRAPSPRVIRAAETLLLPAHDLAAARMAATVNGYVVGTLLRTTLEAVEQAARTAHTLVIQGESGTGKEVAARAFHSRGPHAAGPFVALNCAAIPHGLAERLLFGAKRGAYSGAEADAPGYLQAAHRGVLFLDEVGDLDLQVQAKLLRVLETREVVPLGASTGQPVEVRVCVATHHDLRAAVAAGRFRSDLYYRLAPPVVTLPPLRDRLDEVPGHVATVVGTVAPSLLPQARFVEACMLRSWPGNVRELRKEVHFAATRAKADGRDRVRVEDLTVTAGCVLDADATDPPRAEPVRRRSYVRWSAQITAAQIERALDEHAGNVALAARSLGMQRSQLYREMERWSIPLPARASDQG